MRPHIICHMVTSIDGRLHVDRWTPPAAGIDPKVLRGHYDQIAARFGADGWMVGRKTMSGYAKGSPRDAAASVPDGLRRTHIGDREGRGLAVVVDPHGRLHYQGSLADEEHVVAILGEQVSDGYLAGLRENGVSYLFAGPDGRELERAMEELGAVFGAKTLLLEGGGIINGAFLKAGLIDEISLLMQPAIDGLSGEPSIFEYLGGKDERPAEGRSLRFIAAETLEGGMVWLRYTVEAVANP